MSDVPDNITVPETLDVVLFSVNGWRAGFEARRVRASSLASACLTGKDIELQLGLSPDALTSASASHRQCLRIKWEEGDAKGDKEIFVDGPVDLVCLPVNATYPLPPLLAARNRLQGLRALAMLPETAARQIVLLFDTACLAAGEDEETNCRGQNPL